MPVRLSALRLLIAAGLCLTVEASLHAAPLVPGTGYKEARVGDDFEDPKWAWYGNLPKSSDEIDKQVRPPGGASVNGRWYEGAMRGGPDHLRRVPTPDGGLEGSTSSLLIRTLNSGVPYRPSGKAEQDDLVVNVMSRTGGAISVANSPSCVVRVYLPPFEEWEPRFGNSFGFRASCQGINGKGKMEQYWPGMFIQYNYKRGDKQPPAVLVIRGALNGGDFWGPKITETGWWTLGMSFTPDGAVHYYAKTGVEDLTDADRVTTQYPYGFHCQLFENFFFNVVNTDNGHTWSTPWIIDDPSLYTLRPLVATQRQRSR